MKFSFIIPVYNCGQYLNKIICSIENMDLFDYEIILVDDGSTDDSGIICDKIAEKKDNTYCIHQENQGVSAARNQGLQAASGDFICFFDADDNIVPGNLNKLLRQIENSRTVIDIAVFGMSFDYYHRGNIYRRDPMQPPLQGVLEKSKWSPKLTELFHANSLSPIWNKVFRHSFLIENNLYLRNDMFLYEDLEYSLRCMACSGNILFESEVIYQYRQSEDEGNVSRRLMRIEHIYNLVAQIENVLVELTDLKSGKKEQDEINNILVSLYLVLAREKIAVSNVRQVKKICDDYKEWYEKHKIKIPLESQEYSDLLLRRNVLKLILRREYTKVRHRFAVILKNTRIYHKLKG